MPTKSFDRQLAEHDRTTAAVGLWRTEDYARSVLAPECSVDIQATSVKVEILPSQRQRLSNAKAGGREQHQQRMEALTLGLIKEEQKLVTVQRRHLAPLRPGRIYKLGWVGAN